MTKTITLCHTQDYAGPAPHLPPCRGASVHQWYICRSLEPFQQRNPEPPAKPFNIQDVVEEQFSNT